MHTKQPTSKTYHETVAEVRKFMANASIGEAFTAKDIATALDNSELAIRPLLMDLVRRGVLHTHEVKGVSFYFRDAGFLARHITPIFAGTPDWVVEAFDGRLICWVPNEFNAHLIADSLNRS